MSLMKIDITIGGPNKVVEIDECKIGRRKYNRGKWVEVQWVFGLVERGSNKCMLVPVPNRSRETLVPIIKKYVLPGTKIISDCWKVNFLLNSYFKIITFIVLGV